MHLPSFEYLEPKTVKEACSILSKYKGQAKVLAGGTDLLVMMKQKILTPQYAVNIKMIKGLASVREDKNGLRIGALATLSDIESAPVIRRKFPMLSVAAGSVATKQIRATATLGGNLCLDSKCWYYNQSHIWRKSREACLKRGGDLCHVVKGGKRCYAVLSGDTIPALLALGAKVKIVSSGRNRVLPMEEFFTGNGETPNVLKPEEMLTEIQVPYMPKNAKGAFQKYSMRGSIDFGVVDVAAVVSMGGGVSKDARIAIGSVGPAVVRVREAEELLQEKKIDDEVLEEVGKTAVKGVRLVSGAQSSVYFRRKIIQVLTKRVVRQAAGIG